MKRLLLLGLLALTAAPLPAQDDKDVSWRARGEIARRGAMVEHINGYGAESPISDVMQLPADDSGKWVFTLVVTRGCQWCEQLRADFAGSPQLKAWVDVADYKKSWAHYQVVQIEDKSQAWRWKDYRPTRFPTLLVQPPADHSWGDPHVVVFRLEGYEKPDKLDASLRKTITAYAVKVNKQHSQWKSEQIAKQKKNTGGLTTPNDGGMGQAGSEGTGQPGAWTPPVPPATPLPATPNATPATFPPSTPTPAADPTGGLTDKLSEMAVNLLISVLSMFFPDVKTILLFLTALSNVWLLIRDRARAAGAHLLLPDDVANAIANALKNAQPPSATS